MKIKSIQQVMKDKRGMGIGDIYPVILTIALVGILLAIVMFILDEFGDQTADIAVTRINETNFNLTGSTAGNVVSNASECHFQNFVVLEITNQSTALPILTHGTDYTYDPNTGAVFNLTDMESGGLWNISYSATFGGKSCEATEDIIGDFANFVPWIGIILLVVAAAIVLGILVRSFATPGGERV